MALISQILIKATEGGSYLFRQNNILKKDTYCYASYIIYDLKNAYIIFENAYIRNTCLDITKATEFN